MTWKLINILYGGVWFKNLAEQSDSIPFLMCLFEMEPSGGISQKRMFSLDAEAANSKNRWNLPALISSITPFSLIFMSFRTLPKLHP
jgi:hypothetical protein